MTKKLWKFLVKDAVYADADMGEGEVRQRLAHHLETTPHDYAMMAELVSVAQVEVLIDPEVTA